LPNSSLAPTPAPTTTIGRGLTLDDMERFAEFSGAELVLTYKKTGPAPRRVQGSD
jgi:hypothetical protein